MIFSGYTVAKLLLLLSTNIATGTFTLASTSTNDNMYSNSNNSVDNNSETTTITVRILTRLQVYRNNKSKFLGKENYRYPREAERIFRRGHRKNINFMLSDLMEKTTKGTIVYRKSNALTITTITTLIAGRNSSLPILSTGDLHTLLLPT